MKRLLVIPFFVAGLLLLAAQQECSGDIDGDGWTTEDGDCNDNNADIYPGAEEAVDGLDNDCDGEGKDGSYLPGADEALSADAYEFTRVEIPEGVAVTVEGSNHLELVVFEDFTVAGSLDLSGGDGEPAVSGGQNEERQAGGTGGGGGGYAGGDGGHWTDCDCSADYNGLEGEGPGGGYPGDNGHAMVGGSGGGAGHATEGETGQTGTCGADRCGSDMTYVGGTGGEAYGSEDLSDIEGGSGGAGGGYGHADNGMGGGGGGGGGVLTVSAFSIDISGQLLSNGGDGGSETDGSDGGPGGGGSGGSIWLDATAVSITGVVQAIGGIGGEAVEGETSGYPGNGGAGSDGRIRIDALNLEGTTEPAPYLEE